jgi:phage anti-repressor protein
MSLSNIFVKRRNSNSSITSVVSSSNYENDPIVSRIKEKLGNDVIQQQIFVNSLNMFMKYKDQRNEFVIDFDDVWEFVGFSRKDNALRKLENDLDKDVDYIFFLRTEEKTMEGRGRPVKKIMLKLNSLKEFCILANTDIGKQIRRYFIKMEEIVQDYISEEYQLKLQSIEQEKDEAIKLIEDEKEKIQTELNLLKETKYIEVAFDESVYIMSTDIPGIYKIGLTIRSGKERKKDLQTGNINDIEILYEVKTYNSDILERLVHSVLQKYHYSQEYYRCNLDYIKMIINISANFMNNLKTTCQVVEKDDILDKIYQMIQGEEFFVYKICYINKK